MSNKYNIGDTVYTHNQFNISGPFIVELVNDGCPCCGTHTGSVLYYKMQDSEKYYSEDYVYSTPNLALADLKRWEQLREILRARK